MRSLLFLLSLFVVAQTQVSTQVPATLVPETCTEIINGCISFTVSSGTGCNWMCNYCANQLGPSYYFTDGVCQYQSGGCVGNPQAGVTYTCCSV